MIPCDTDGGSLGAWHDVGAEAEALNSGANLSDVLLGGLRAHDDQQEKWTSGDQCNNRLLTRAAQNVKRSCSSNRRLSAFSEKPSPFSVPAI